MGVEFFSLFLIVVSILITNVDISDKLYEMWDFELKNTSLSKLELNNARGIINSSHFYFEVLGQSKIGIKTNTVFSDEISTVDITLLLKSGKIEMETRNVEGDCEGGPCKKVEKVDCNFDISVEDLDITPSSSAVTLAIKSFLLPKYINDIICGGLKAYLPLSIEETTMIPPLPVPVLPSEEAMPINKSLLVRAALNVFENFPEVYGIKTSASLLEGTTIHVELEFSNGINAEIKDLLKMADIFKELKKFANAVLFDNTTEKTLGEPKKEVAKETVESELNPFTMDVNAFGSLNTSSFNISFDVVFNDLQCEEDGLVCTLPNVDGIKLQNVRLTNLDGWSRIVTNNIAPSLTTAINSLIQKTVDAFEKNNSRVNIPVIKQAEPEVVPPTYVLVCAPILSVIIFAGTALLDIWKHRRVTVLRSDGSALSLKRKLLEDLIFISGVLISANGFLWSNFTSAGVLYVGNEFRWIDLNLYTSLKTVYDAGALIFTIFILFFSCVYPYLKLGAMVLCTLVLQKPESIFLKLVDIFGKFSFLDVYAMLFMNIGLQTEGVTQLELLPGFHLFVVSTILSILLGNYAVNFWRYKTSLRKNFGEEEEGVLSESSDNKHIDKEGKKSVAFWKKILVKGWPFRLLHAAVVIVCVIPLWAAPSVRYTVKGVSSYFVDENRDASMWQLASFHWFLLIVSMLTTIVAPISFALIYPSHLLPATWSGIDVLSLTFIAGLTQHSIFVKETLGKKLEGVYELDSKLLWPTYPLITYAIFQWVFIVDQLFSISKRIVQYIKERREKSSFSPY